MKTNEKPVSEFVEKGGFKMDLSMKRDAVDSPFIFIPPAKEMVVFLRQHIGPETKPSVQVGDKVFYGQKIGDDLSGGPLVVPIHSPVNGRVVALTQRQHPESGKKEMALIIETHDDKQKPYYEPLDPDDATTEELQERVREAGVVGLGGASFPTHVKLSPEKPISHLLINAKESDPNIACDSRLMVEKPAGIITGIKLMTQMLEADEVIFATRTKEGEIPEFEKLLGENDIPIIRIRPSYSIGSEKLLIKEILDKEIPYGKYPPDIGAVVHNVSTAHAVKRAVIDGEPLVSRGLTMYSKKTGGKNLWVRMGTPVEHVLESVGVSPSEFERIVIGSTMMGPSIPNSSYPVLKATSGITAFTQKEPDPYRNPLPCIRCGYCNTVCPVDIYPQLIMEAEKAGDIDRLKKLHVEVCIDCGLCSYVCPSRIRFTPYLQRGKQKIRDT
ncbi:electron transport complex subunit RsxC [Candidatus Thorarchaeota archaeon]|nr:MAG: electron transport complex subunit RsxC [Candidatus Thorarchaeota archaeon]